MRIRAFASRKRFLAIVCAGLAAFICGASNISGATQSSPLLFSVSATSTRAIVLESVSMRAEPFSLYSEQNFSPSDPRTRITLFCMNLDLLASEGANSLTADAEDGGHSRYPLKVEYVGQVPGFEGIYMVVLRLNDLMTSNLGDVLVRLNLHGMGSNRVRVGIGQIGGGPADDNPGVGTPAPTTPPPAVTAQTIAQFQGQFSNPATAAGPDGIRFLEQATWGPSDADLAHLRSIGMQAYLNEQFNTPPLFGDVQSNYPLTTLYPINSPCGTDAICQRDNYTLYPLQKLFVTNALTQPDQLRQRIAFALHKFIVVAGRDLNNNETSWYAPYLQIFDRNAFGNFRQILFDITLNPGMGLYLNMAGNSKAAPNENYARELMQLFSIGTDVLNQDGTPVLDANGNRVPTYGQTEITNFARVFTGWVITNTTANTINGQSVPDYIRPMALSNNTGANGPFDIGAKTLLNPEARGDVKPDTNSGHLREPILLMTNLLRMFNATSDGVLTTNVSGAGSFTTPLGQDIFNPPTVFSYFPADYGLPGTNLVAPEFGILDTLIAYQRTNFVNTLLLANNGNGIPPFFNSRPSGTQVNYANYQAQAGTPA